MTDVLLLSQAVLECDTERVDLLAEEKQLMGQLNVVRAICHILSQAISQVFSPAVDCWQLAAGGCYDHPLDMMSSVAMW